ISAPAAWDIETGSSETIVAVLDAGFDLDHEDLVGQYWVNMDETDGDDRDNDSNGFEDDVQGWDFVDGDAEASPDESGSDTVVSHGTVIAGIIGATANNGLGITGINWSVSIMPLRVLDKNGSGSTANVRHAIEYAVENGADVINLSFTFIFGWSENSI
ncbi:MAG: S8 family serine peptidase, partial [Patescibacteria group bacterium]